MVSALKCILSSSRKEITIREVVNHVYVEKAIYEINPVLLSKKYNPKYFFEGTPILSERGMIVTIKLDKPISQDDWLFIKRLLQLYGFTIVEE